MDSKLLARIGAVVFVAIAITVAAIEAARDPAGAPEPAGSAQEQAAAVDPLVAEMRRCQQLGQEGASDRACLRAWAENRRRFLSPGARPLAPLDPADETTRPAAGEEP